MTQTPRTHRRPHNRADLELCVYLAEHNPEWSVPQVEAEATKIRLGVIADPRKEDTCNLPSAS